VDESGSDRLQIDQQCLSEAWVFDEGQLLAVVRGDLIRAGGERVTDNLHLNRLVRTIRRERRWLIQMHVLSLPHCKTNGLLTLYEPCVSMGIDRKERIRQLLNQPQKCIQGTTDRWRQLDRLTS